LFRKQLNILKIVPKAGYECTLEKTTNESEGKPEQKFDTAFRTIFRSRQKLNFYFSLELSRQKFKKTFAHVQRVRYGTDLIV
jgi:hypothetical protein